jgi:hypothetical protein
VSPDRAARAAARDLVRAALASCVAIVALGAQQGALCGEERWDVKVLRDADAARVDLNAQPTTIAALVGIPRPRETRPASGRLDLERRTFRVRARLLEVRTQADGDLHLVLSDVADPSARLVAEIPDSVCAVGTRRASDYAEAQRWALQTGTPIEVEVEGVAFWDDEHGQVGMARNGIELHPVLRITPVLTRSDILRAEVGADAPDPRDVRVWVNTSSKVYHCPGSANYGTTARGQYMPESTAVRSGARPASGVSCRRP